MSPSPLIGRTVRCRDGGETGVVVAVAFGVWDHAHPDNEFHLLVLDPVDGALLNFRACEVTVEP